MTFGRECDLKELLADALRQAVSEYVAFAATPVRDGTSKDNADDAATAARDLLARHATGKIMIGHITALAKLVHSWPPAGEEAAADSASAFPDMVATARDAVSRYAVDAG